MATRCRAVSARRPGRALRAGHHPAAVRRSAHAALAPCARQLPAVASHPGVGAVAAMHVALIGAQVRPVPADILLIGTDVGSVALDISPVGGDVGLVTPDVAVLIGPGALRRIVMPQVRPVRTNILTVPPDATAVTANIRPVMGDVRAVMRHIALVRPHIAIGVRSRRSGL